MLTRLKDRCNVKKMITFLKLLIVVSGIMLTACSTMPEENSVDEPEILTIYPDGSMKLMGRQVAPEDIVIYPDGYGGEKAAIKSGLNPIHPPFYRDTIIVDRVVEEEDTDD
jgi:hypothetical protein